MNNTLANGLQLLAHLSATAEAHSVTELAQRLKVPKSHAHRLLQTLVELGYALQDEDRRYRIGLEPLAVSRALLANHPLRRLARPHLHRLAEATGLDAVVAVPWRPAQALIIGAAHPQGEPRDQAMLIGGPLAFPGTATGKLLAVLRPGFADPATLTSAERREIARSEIAYKDPGFAGGVNGLAVAVRDADGAVIGALGMSGGGAAFAAGHLRAAKLLRAAVADIAATLALPSTA